MIIPRRRGPFPEPGRALWPLRLPASGVRKDAPVIFFPPHSYLIAIESYRRGFFLELKNQNRRPPHERTDLYGNLRGPWHPTAAASAVYVPGVYTSSIMLSGSAVDVAVTVSADEIESIRLVNVGEAVETMYPLMEPALDSLAEQICSTQSLEGLTYASENQYTSQVLIDAVSRALDKAAVPTEEE